MQTTHIEQRHQTRKDGNIIIIIKDIKRVERQTNSALTHLGDHSTSQHKT